MNTPRPLLPYDKLGGAAGVQQLVQRFFELVDELPEAWTIRRLYPSDRTPCKERLIAFLSGWLGGPPLSASPSPPADPSIPLDTQARDEWRLCMRLALADQIADSEFRDILTLAFDQMADLMVMQAAQAAAQRQALAAH